MFCSVLCCPSQLNTLQSNVCCLMLLLLLLLLLIPLPLQHLYVETLLKIRYFVFSFFSSSSTVHTHIYLLFSVSHNQVFSMCIFQYLCTICLFPISVLVVFCAVEYARGHYHFIFSLTLRRVVLLSNSLRFILRQQVFEHKMLISTHVFFVILSSFCFWFLALLPDTLEPFFFHLLFNW